MIIFVALSAIYVMAGKVTGKVSDGEGTRDDLPTSRNQKEVPNSKRAFKSYLSRDIEFSQVSKHDFAFND